MKWLRKLLFSDHRWEYRNPYDRTCAICGRHEVSHCRGMETWNIAWWEVFDEGDPQAHKEGEIA